MKIEISIIECKRDVDGWTEYADEKDAERIELSIRSAIHKIEATYFTKNKSLKITFMPSDAYAAGLFKEAPFKPGDHESALTAIEEEINKHSKIPHSIDVIWNG